jgi:protein O-mannosyl-transferase
MFNRLKAVHAGLCLVLALTWLVYRPGLSGPFLFDDYANLPALGASGPVDDWPTFERYVTSGIADPTGRPVALTSFLIDANNWPAAPYAFKRTNLILHLLNGVLLYLLLGRLGVALGRQGIDAGRAKQVALLATALWLLHPLFVSTTLYIVQREAMLPVTFVTLGLLGWINGRTRIARGSYVAGSAIAATSIIGGTALAVLSKANGILLPGFVLVIEYGLLARTEHIENANAARTYGALLRLIKIACGLLAASLLYIGVRGILQGIGDQRPWTLGQRLLTEPRVLWEYLRLLWLPHPYTAGVFNDQVAVSTSLTHPWTTLPALTGVLALISAAVVFRKRVPVAATAVLFFFVGHAMESTTIPLELYFEHRNYLPSLLLFWPLSAWLLRQSASLDHPPTLSVLRRAICAVAVVGLAAMTYSNATIWGNGQEQAALWAALNPLSPRAQVNAAQSEIARGNPTAAIARLTPLLRQHPEEVQLALNVLAARCADHSLSTADIDRARNAMSDARDPGTLLVTWFSRALSDARAEVCPGLDLPALSTLANAGASNPRFPNGRRQDLSHIQGLISLEQRDPQKALAEFQRALALDPNPGIALEQAAILGSAGYPAEGLQHLATFDGLPASDRPGAGMPMIHKWILERQHYWARERAHLEQTLRTDLQQGKEHR